MYSRILKIAYELTINHIFLWFFGLFLVGGFNAVVFHVLGIKFAGLSGKILILIQTGFNAPGLVIFLAVISFLLGVIITTSARVVLITFVLKFLQIRTLKQNNNSIISQHGFLPIWLSSLQNFNPEFKKPPIKQVMKQSLLPAAIISLGSNLFILIATALISSPQVLLSNGGDYTKNWFVIILLLLPLSCLALYSNMFPSYFIITFRASVSSAIKLSYDILLAKYKIILSFGLLLFIVYCLGFSAIFSIVNYMRQAITLGLQPLIDLGFLPISAIIPAVRYGGIGIAWLLLAILNTFSNIALLLLFIKLVTPEKGQALEHKKGYLFNASQAARSKV